MTKHIALKLAALAVATAFSGIAAAAVTELGGQYQLQTSYTQDAEHTFTFTYTVKNVNQGYANTTTGLDGFTIYIPTAATVVSASLPASYVAGQGYWTSGASPMLDLSYGGSNTDHDMVAPSGYLAYSFWGQGTGSVYQLDSTATFSIKLDNVSLGTNAVGISTYYGGYGVPADQPYVHNSNGNYTTFTTNAFSAVTAVPEPETYAMLLAGLGIMGFVARRRRQA